MGACRQWLSHCMGTAEPSQQGPCGRRTQNVRRPARHRKILFLFHGGKLWPLPDSNTGPFCNGHTWVASFNISVSVLRVTGDLNQSSDLQKVQSRLSRPLGGAHGECGSEGLARLRHRPRSQGILSPQPQSTAGAARGPRPRGRGGGSDSGACRGHAGGQPVAYLPGVSGGGGVWPALHQHHLSVSCLL